MVSWQRLLSGRFRDPLVGRDMLLGILAGSAIAAVLCSANALLVIPRLGTSEANHVNPTFGQGLWQAVGFTISQPASTCIATLIYIAILAIMTGILRRRWLGLTALGLIWLALISPTSLLDLAFSVLYVVVSLAVMVRVGLIGSVCFYIVWHTLGFSPPLVLTHWYAGRAVIALLLPLALLVWGFYASLGGQPIFGSSLKED